MIDVRRLRLLAELEARGTVAAVGAALHLSPPGVSTQLSALEREVGLTLTEKDGRRIRLTAAGKRLAAHARVLLDQLEIIDSEIVAARDGTRGSFRVASFPSAARTIVAQAWRSLLDAGSEVTITLDESEPDAAIPALGRGELDLAVTHSYSNVPRSIPAGVEAQPLASERVWLAVRKDDVTLGPKSPSGQAGAPIDLRTMSRHDWVLPHSTWSCHEMVQRACGAAGFVPRVVAQASDFAVLAQLVAAGAGVALLPDLTIDRLPDDVCLRELQQPVQRHVFLLSRAASGSDPAMAALIGEIRRAADRVMAVQLARWAG